MGLGAYVKKRDFTKTTEPRGKRDSAPSQFEFFVQKHAASHLHYDLRLALDGVLKSWAVPKGPDLDPSHKRLAVQVEDHPLEYGTFEGTIPKGQYGGGTVMVWDQGFWSPVGDAMQGLQEGRLKFSLHGEKLQGAWMLVRRGGRNSNSEERNWFLIKEKDEFASTEKCIIDSEPSSILTGRSLDEISNEQNRVVSDSIKDSGTLPRPKPRRTRRLAVARSEATQGPGPKNRMNGKTTLGDETLRAGTQADEVSKETRSARISKLLVHPNIREAEMPTTQTVELATLTRTAPTGAGWSHEIKFDGYRMLCRVENGKVRFISRNGNDWTKKFPGLAKAAQNIPFERTLLDGEVVALDSNGISRFQSLQNVLQTGRQQDLVFYAFDILYLNDRDVTNVPLEHRRKILNNVVAACRGSSIRMSEHIEGDGSEVVAQACRMSLEGIVSKRTDSLYRAGRGTDWLKTKCSHRAEFVVGGFTPPSGSRHHFGALLVGNYTSERKLSYAGRVGTGFDEQTLKSLYKKFQKLIEAQSPFENLTGKTGAARGVQWLRPELVVEVEFSNWTDDQLLRHASFQGLREDKPAIEVIRDVPVIPELVDALAGKKMQKPKAKSRTKVPSMIKTHLKKSIPKGTLEVERVQLSHPDKILYAEPGYTKRDLANYYVQIAEWILPHIKNRPLALVRCPGGRSKPCFFQKHPDESGSKHLRELNVSQKSKPDYQLAVTDKSGLVTLVQMGVLEIHTWGSQANKLERPDRLVFDLDPDLSVNWPTVVRAAREVRLVLEELGLNSFLKTTGGKGLHVVVPIQARLEWDEAKSFCKSIADMMVRAAPDRYVATMSLAARKGKIFVDYLRNGRGATSIAPYSTRAKPGAPVSLPISWEELSPKLRSDHFTLDMVLKRLAHLKLDPWAEIMRTKQTVTKAMRKRLES